MDILPGLYRHFKGGLYRVEGVARHSETLEEMVVYRAFYPSFTAGEIVTSSNFLKRQRVQEYFFVKLCIFCCLPFCIVMV